MKFYPPKTDTATREASILQKGEIVLDWDTNKLYIGTGGTGGVELGTGIDPNTTRIQFSQIPTPTNSTPNTTLLYSKSDGQLYYLPNGGSESMVGSGNGGGGTVPRNLIQAIVTAAVTI